MEFKLTEKDCLKLETIMNAKYEWDSDAGISLLEGGANIWYTCRSIEGLFLNRQLDEEEWVAYYYKDEMGIDVGDSYLRINNQPLKSTDVNDLLIKVEQLIEKNKLLII